MTARGRTRSASPALSDTSELTMLSRSPSPVFDYDRVLTPKREPRGISPAFPGVSEFASPFTPPSPDKLRSPDGRFVSRRPRRALSPSPERPAKRPRRLTIGQQKASLKRTRRYAEPPSPTPETASSMGWITGKGGSGALGKLPKEIRQEIYAYSFGTARPVTLKNCCGPNTTERERDACRKHGVAAGIDVGRFNILRVSKEMRDDAMWVIFNQGCLSLDTMNAIAPYLKGCRSKGQRGVADVIQNDKWKSAMWNTASQFRFTTIDVPENMIQFGDPTVFTDRLISIATLLCKEQHGIQTVKRSVHVKLGSMFHQMLPFNMESQGESRYGELLDWLYVNYPYNDPDLDKLTLESEHNLQRLLSIIGKHSGRSQWHIFAKTQIDEKDEGGERALHAFQVGCANNGVVFEHMKWERSATGFWT